MSQTYLAALSHVKGTQPPPPVTSCDHFKQNTVYPSISQDCGENWPQGWDWSCREGKNWVPTVPMETQLLLWDRSYLLAPASPSQGWLGLYMLSVLLCSPILLHCPDLGSPALPRGPVGKAHQGWIKWLPKSPEERRPGWLPEPEAGALHGSGDTYPQVPHDAVLSVQSSSALWAASITCTSGPWKRGAG